MEIGALRAWVTLPLVVLAFAGCLGGNDDDLVLDAPTDVIESVLEFTGSVARGERQEHPLAVPEDALWADIAVTFDGAGTPFSAPSFVVLDAAGEVVRPPAPFTTGSLVFPRLVLEEKGSFGDWTLRVSGSSFATAAVEYAITAVVATGDIAPAAVVAPTAPVAVETDRVVVAVIDTGINVYHEAFRSNTTPVADAYDAITGDGARDIPLTLDGNERVVDGAIADDPYWRGVEPGVLYRFEGTRVLGISFTEPQRGDLYPVLDNSGHGTATAATVLQQHPEAEIVMLEVSAASWNEIAAATEWAAAQPWIDIISVSMGNPGNAPVIADALDNAMPAATKKAVEAGKVYIESAGNDPTLTFTDNADGPPWVITVSGAEKSSQSRDILPSYGGVEFVSDFSVKVANYNSVNGTGWIQGTSFSCPATAGAFAKALQMVRDETGHVGGTNGRLLVDTPELQLEREDLLDAMARAAVYWDATDYDPTSPPGEDPITGALGAGTPFLPGAPWITAGWGYVDATVGEAAAHHILGHEELPEKPAGAHAWMTAQQSVRQAIWGNFA